MKRVLLYLFAFLAIEFMVETLAGFVYALVSGSSGPMPPLWTIGTMVAYSLAVIIVFLKAGWFTASSDYLRSRPWAVLAWCVVASLGAIVPSLLVQGLIPEWSGWAKEIVDKPTNSWRE